MNTKFGYMTIEEIFNKYGIKKVFKKDGTFTKKAVENYDFVRNYFFDTNTERDNFDKVCSEERCW